MRTLKIDPEFRDKVPPLTPNERATLEENIVTDGRVLVPLVVWNGTIVDGHNRYSIVQKHPEIPYDIVEREFPDRYAAIVWICRNQLGRRNLTDEQKTYLIGKQYEAQKMTQGGDRGNQYAKVANTQSGDLPKQRTIDKIAAEHSIGANTVHRAEKFAKGVDAAERIAPGAKEKILAGVTKVPKVTIASIPAMEESQQIDVVEALMTGDYKRPAKENGHTRVGYTKEMRVDRAETQAIVADLYDPTTVPEFTVEMLIEDIQVNAANYVQMLRNTLIDRCALLTDENRPAIAEAIEKDVIEKIRKVKELVER